MRGDDPVPALPLLRNAVTIWLLAPAIPVQTEIMLAVYSDCTRLGLSHLYWVYVTTVTLHCARTRTLADLQRYRADP
jgi:hypothetical protein